MSIGVTDRFTVEADQTFAFKDEFGFFLEGDGAPVLENFGTISLKTTTDGQFLSAIYASADGARIFNRVGATIEVDQAQGFRQPSAIIVEGDDSSLVNQGVIRAVDTVSSVVRCEGYGFNLRNTGLIETDAAGVYVLGDARVENRGQILARIYAFHIAPSAASGGVLLNTGLIQSVSSDEAVAVSLAMATGGYVVDNQGRIIARGGDGSAMLAIALPHDTTALTTIDNAGLIRGAIGLAGEEVSSRTTLANSGTIVGDVQLGYLTDRLINTGSLKGYVHMGGGDDIYLGRHGQLDGVLEGGGGADQLAAGSGDQRILGDGETESGQDGADTIDGGAGADTLLGGGGNDVLIGGGDADELTGGSGADRFIFMRSGDSNRAHFDLITDLQSGDLVDLSAIDADRGQAGDQSFHKVAAFDGHAGELTLSYDAHAGVTWLRGDTDGDGKAEFVLALSGDQSDFTGIVP